MYTKANTTTQRHSRSKPKKSNQKTIKVKQDLQIADNRSEIVQRHVFKDGKALTFNQAKKALGGGLTGKEPLLRTLIDSKNHYLFEDVERRLGIEGKPAWRTTGSTRPDRSDVTGKIGERTPDSHPATLDREMHIPRTESYEGFETVAENREMEENIGSILLSSSEVIAIAREIKEITSSFSTTSDKDIRKNAYKHKQFWAGAQGFMHGRGGVDEYVYATTQHVEATVKGAGTEREKEDRFKQWKNGYPEGNVLHKRLENHAFDQQIEGAPPSKWSLEQRASVISEYRAQTGTVESDSTIFTRLNAMPTEERTSVLKKLKIRDSRSTNLAGDTASPLEIVSSRGPEYRQATSGRQFNVIVDEEYIRTADELKKPVLSGPSGTAFRYLKGWHEIRVKNGNKGPTLQQALLVSMANLMPPNGHHSYHEIMDSCVGIGDLAYGDRSGYGDLGSIVPGLLEKAKTLVTKGTSHRVRLSLPESGEKRHF